MTQYVVTVLISNVAMLKSKIVMNIYEEENLFGTSNKYIWGLKRFPVKMIFIRMSSGRCFQVIHIINENI